MQFQLPDLDQHQESSLLPGSCTLNLSQEVTTVTVSTRTQITQNQMSTPQSKYNSKEDIAYIIFNVKQILCNVSN